MPTLRRLLPAVLILSAVCTPMAFGTGCASRSSAPEDSQSRWNEYREKETRKSVDDLTPEFMNDLSSMIGSYREMSNNPADLRKAHAARMRAVSLVKPYLPAMEYVLINGGSTERRNISAVGLGFVDESSLADEAIRLLVYQVLDPQKNADPVTIYYALIGLAELGRLEYTREYRGGKAAPDPLPEDWQPYPTRDELLLAIAVYLSDEYPDVRAAAAEAVGRALRQGEQPAILDDVIQRLAREPEPDIRLLLVEALAYIGDVRGLQQIEAQALVDSDPWVREDAVIALGRSGRPQYLEPLISMLEDTDSRVRTQAVEMLRERCKRMVDQNDGMISDEPATPGTPASQQLVSAITERLRDNDAHVRERAILALGHIGDERVVMDLMSKLGDSRRDVRKAAIYSLGLLRTKADRAVPQLIKMLSNRDDDVRAVSRLALVSITGQDLGDDATEWQKWFDAGRPGIRPAKTDADDTVTDKPAPEGSGGNGTQTQPGNTPPADSGIPTPPGDNTVSGTDN